MKLLEITRKVHWTVSVEIYVQRNYRYRMATLYSRRVHSRAARYAALQSVGGGAGARASETVIAWCHHATSSSVARLYIFTVCLWDSMSKLRLFRSRRHKRMVVNSCDCDWWPFAYRVTAGGDNARSSVERAALPARRDIRDSTARVRITKAAAKSLAGPLIPGTAWQGPTATLA